MHRPCFTGKFAFMITFIIAFNKGKQTLWNEIFDKTVISILVSE